MTSGTATVVVPYDGNDWSTQPLSAGAVSAGTAVTLTVTRTSSDRTRPLAVTYALSGTAQVRYDYDGLPGMIVIPAGQTTASVTSDTQRVDTGTDTRSATIPLTQTPAVSCYTTGSAGAATAQIAA
ncbi:MAG: hypothetical protein J0H43_10075 [Actinobacteria bacterium]|nr:hypothetical protein [Actinomycetota bacterium]